MLINIRGTIHKKKTNEKSYFEIFKLIFPDFVIFWAQDSIWVISVVVDHGWPGGHMGRFFGCSKTLIDKEYYAKKRYWLSLITFEILARQNLYQERRKTAIWPLRDVHGRPNLDSSKELVELYKIQ